MAARSESAATEAPPGAGQGGSAREPGKAIVVSGLEKRFEIPHHRPATLKERALHPLRRIPATEVVAARELSFDVARGEFFGIVGRNGSGKSTLLRLLAGIYEPDAGTIEVEGRVSPFIELGVGFNPDLEARDNVLINGTMLGLSRREAARRYPSIIRFAELEQFEEMKLKNYSSGMQVRLAFSIAIQVDADVILLDEVLAVGDAGFQEKCFDQFRRLKAEGRTIVLVTHSMDAVRRFCDRAMMLEAGRAVAIGDPDRVAERYREAAAESPAAAAETAAAEASAAGSGGRAQPQRYGDRSAEVIATWVESSIGERRGVVEQGERIALCAEFAFNRRTESPTFGIQLHGEAGATAFAANTFWSGVETPDFDAGERATLRIEIDNWLGVGTYAITPGVASRDATTIADVRFGLGSFRVDGRHWTGGGADLPAKFRVERGGRSGGTS